MTFSKAIATFALTIVTLLAANMASAQYSYQKSWESSNSWSSSWGTGPNGTHSTYDQQSSQKSNESTTIGGRTISNSQDHSQQSGHSRGYDQHGVYNNTYANQQGTSVYTDTNRRYGRLGGTATQTQQLTNTYNNSSGLNQSWDPNGNYHRNGYQDQHRGQTVLNRLQGTGVFGNRYGNQLVQDISGNQNSTFNQGFDRFGNQIINQRTQGNAINQQINFRRW